MTDLAPLMRAALEVLDAFGRAASPETSQALEAVLDAGGTFAVAVVAGHADLPEVLLCVHASGGDLTPFARVIHGQLVEMLH